MCPVNIGVPILVCPSVPQMLQTFGGCGGGPGSGVGGLGCCVPNPDPAAVVWQKLLTFVESCFLIERKQGGHKGLALFAPSCLGDGM